MSDVETDNGQDATKVKDSWMWIKDSSGYGSVTVTFLTISFYITTLAYLSSIVEKIGPVSFRQFDVAASGAYFGLILATYLGRKWTDAKYKPNEPK